MKINNFKNIYILTTSQGGLTPLQKISLKASKSGQTSRIEKYFFS